MGGDYNSISRQKRNGKTLAPVCECKANYFELHRLARGDCAAGAGEVIMIIECAMSGFYVYSCDSNCQNDRLRVVIGRYKNINKNN